MLDLAKKRRKNGRKKKQNTKGEKKKENRAEAE